MNFGLKNILLALLSLDNDYKDLHKRISIDWELNRGTISNAVYCRVADGHQTIEDKKFMEKFISELIGSLKHFNAIYSNTLRCAIGIPSKKKISEVIKRLYYLKAHIGGYNQNDYLRDASFNIFDNYSEAIKIIEKTFSIQ